MRTVVDRLAGAGDHTVAAEMLDAASAGEHAIDVRTDGDTVERIRFDIRTKRIRVRPPIGKQKRYPRLDLTLIQAAEIGTPEGPQAHSLEASHGHRGRVSR
ncbi:hypothetical protein ACI7BZ_06865 [Xanthobacter sp. AM11]|uniref:hypothetical protein n=1 Tax=Xanthobacter sp. AM11 TaxID=3380643 RepID=UPI0039BF62F0